MAKLLLPDRKDIVDFGEPDLGAWLRPLTLLVFALITGGVGPWLPGQMFTATEHNRVLASYERYQIQAVADNVTGTTVTVSVAYEHSVDERTWVAKNVIPEVNLASLPVGATTDVRSSGFGSGPRASHGAARLRIALGGTSPKAHVKVWVTLRPYA